MARTTNDTPISTYPSGHKDTIHKLFRAAPESFATPSLADTEAYTFEGNVANGLYMVTVSGSHAQLGIFGVSNTAATAYIYLLYSYPATGSSGGFTTTNSTDNRTNVDLTGSGLRIENQLGGSATYSVQRLG